MIKSIRTFVIPLVTMALVALTPHSAQATNTYAIAGKTTAVIFPDDGSGVTCVGINNYHPQGIPVFVPADTLAEWQTFKAHKQSYVEIVPCPNCPAGSLWVAGNAYGGGGTVNYPAFPQGQNYTVSLGGGKVMCIAKLPPGWGVCTLDAAWGPSTATLQCQNNVVSIVSGSYGDVNTGNGGFSPSSPSPLSISADGTQGLYSVTTSSGGGSSGGCGSGLITGDGNGNCVNFNTGQVVSEANGGSSGGSVTTSTSTSVVMRLQ